MRLISAGSGVQVPAPPPIFHLSSGIFHRYRSIDHRMIRYRSSVDRIDHRSIIGDRDIDTSIIGTGTSALGTLAAWHLKRRAREHPSHRTPHPSNARDAA